MNISKTLQEAIDKKDILGIHSSFYTIALSDPGFSTGKFEEVLNYVKEKKIDGFLEPHDDEEFLDKELWTEEYWSHTASKLQDNFSEERIQHLIDVGKKVYPNTEKKIQNQNTKRTYSGSTTKSKVKSTRKAEDKTSEETSELWKGIAFAAGMILLFNRILKGDK